MNVLEIETFLTIVETQSLSAASKKLFISQSTVSNRLNNLEDSLNTKLIERNQGQRFINLTCKGEEFVNFAKRWLALQKDIKLWINEESPLKLNIGSVDSLNNHLFSDIYADIIKNELSFELDVSSHWSGTVFTLLESYDIDYGLVPRSIKTDNLISKPIFSENLVVISNPEFTSINDCVYPEDLDVRKEIYLDWGASFNIWHDSYWNPKSNIELSADTVGLILKFIDRPNTWAILPESIAFTYSKTYSIKISRFVKSPPERIVYKVIHRNPAPRTIKPIRIFEEYLKGFIKSNPFLTEI